MLLTLDGAGPLYQQLYRAIREAILGAKLSGGSQLPSTRSLSTELGLSRNVVLIAYEQLLAEGYLSARRGSGTFVASELPEALTSVARARSPTSTDRSRLRPPDPALDRPPHLSSYARRIVRESSGAPLVFTPSRKALPYDFRYGRPSLADFPHETWCRLVARRARAATVRDLDYGPPHGALPLREAICNYLARSRGVTSTPERVVVVDGSQQALDLVGRILLDPGDLVVLEEPHYRPAGIVFSAVGARLVSVPVDAHGLRVSEIPAGGKYRLAYVTPSHQFPSGVVMPLSRRLELFAWAERTGAMLFEDDYDSEYRYTGRPIEALQGLDRKGLVIYAGTFSKPMFPALRIGYLVVPENLNATFRLAKTLADTGSATLSQLALADFIREGHFERHVRRSRARNAARRVALLGAIDRYLGARVEVAGANAGLHVLLWLRDVAEEQTERIRRRALALGVGVYSVSPFFRQSLPQRAGLLLGYASLTEREIDTGIRKLGSALN